MKDLRVSQISKKLDSEADARRAMLRAGIAAALESFIKHGSGASIDPSVFRAIWSTDPFTEVDDGYIRRWRARKSPMDFIATHDLTSGGGFSFSGVHKHVWFGCADDLRGSAKIARALSRQCVELIYGTSKERPTSEYLTQAITSYFSQGFILPQSLAIVMVNVGHLRYARGFSQFGLKYTKRRHRADILTAPGVATTGNRVVLDDLVHRSLHQPFPDLKNTPWTIANCHGDPESVLWKRFFVKKFTHHGVESDHRERVLQIGPGRPTLTAHDLVPDNKNLYFENTRPLREQTDKLQFTDTTGINLIRICHTNGFPWVHHLVFNLNRGILRGGIIKGIDNRPDQLLNFEYSEVPLSRFQMIYNDMFQLIRSSVVRSPI